MRLAFITVATIACQPADVDANFLACYARIFIPQICMFTLKNRHFIKRVIYLAMASALLVACSSK
jgi:hypothetical protein